MRWVQWGKIPNELLNTGSDVKFVKHLYSQAVRQCFRKSLRLLNPVVQISDCNGDDSTVRVEFDAYKMPRIVKRLLTHKL